MAKAIVPFSYKLVLNRFLLSLFGADAYTLDEKKDPFKDTFGSLQEESLELPSKQDGLSGFYHHLLARLPDNSPVSAEQLLAFEENIQRHTVHINEKRQGQMIRWKYFQYLTLLFTEIYLDWYFRDSDDLLEQLNQHLDQFNASLAEWGEKKANLLKPFTQDQLTKLAYWNATGSGKTLLMHVNLLQYMHYLEKHRQSHLLNRIVVLTPNEGLTQQHLEEFRLSNITAGQFSKVDHRQIDVDLGKIIDVVDMNKLREEGKKKTVSVDAFGKNNLVLIDEGHRGAKGDVWSEMRARLAEEGFTFEYSATLGQAVSTKVALADEYAKSILFDYSYRYFHADGFGKDYQILNIDAADRSEAERKNRHLYLTASLLSFYQQLRVFTDRQAQYKAFAIAKPLWVFVGSKVAAVRTENRQQVSDVVDILLFIAEFVREKSASVDNIRKLVSGNTGLLNQKKKDIFAEAYPYLVETGDSAEALFTDILSSLFNAPASGRLHVDLLKGGDGELALRLGSSDENFGVINVGDASKVKKLCEEQDSLKVGEKPFSSSLFQGINEKGSAINLLIGSKRFSEGWNSYRVSTLGLMFVGRTEGAEIIQLFGRGIRLRGFEHSLKRSRAIHWTANQRDEMQWVSKDPYLPILETLNVFGVKADYMAQFNAFLEGEGIKKSEDFVTKTIKVKTSLPKTPLITVKVPDDVVFKKQQKTELLTPKEFAETYKHHDLNITLDWYPRVTSKMSGGVRVTRHGTELNTETLRDVHLAFLDFDAIYKAMQQLKAERNWHNLNLSPDVVRETLQNSDWYTLYIPKQKMALQRFEQYFEWQEIAITLLKKYCDRCYTVAKDAFEAPYREFAELAPDDPNFFEAYTLRIDESERMILNRIDELQERINNGTFKDLELAGRGEALFFGQHLYSPLLHLNSGTVGDLVKVSPTHLNKGEYDFVCDLRDYHASQPTLLEGKEIYLLRNQARGRGIGFFEVGNFYPDFILWVIDGDKQHIIFVDPKGILHSEGMDDPKLNFYVTIKALEQRMRDDGKAYADQVEMHSFVISNTPFGKLRWKGAAATLDDFAARHVLFQKDDTQYIEKIAGVITRPELE